MNAVINKETDDPGVFVNREYIQIFYPVRAENSDYVIFLSSGSRYGEREPR